MSECLCAKVGGLQEAFQEWNHRVQCQMLLGILVLSDLSDTSGSRPDPVTGQVVT